MPLLFVLPMVGGGMLAGCRVGGRVSPQRYARDYYDPQESRFWKTAISLKSAERLSSGEQNRKTTAAEEPLVRLSRSPITSVTVEKAVR